MNLVDGVIQLIVALELGNDGLFQLRDTIYGRIFGVPGFNRPDGRLLDVFRRIEIRLTCTQPDDILSRCLEFARLVGHSNGRRWLDSAESV